MIISNLVGDKRLIKFSLIHLFIANLVKVLDIYKQFAGIVQANLKIYFAEVSSPSSPTRKSSPCRSQPRLPVSTARTCYPSGSKRSKATSCRTLSLAAPGSSLYRQTSGRRQTGDKMTHRSLFTDGVMKGRAKTKCDAAGILTFSIRDIRKAAGKERKIFSIN